MKNHVHRQREVLDIVIAATAGDATAEQLSLLNQLILDDAFDHLKNEQAMIVAKVDKVKPIENASIWLSVIATVFVAGYYVVDIARQFK